jgi:adenylate cyclase
MLETSRDDASATIRAADALLESTKEHGIKTYTDLGQAFLHWAQGRLLDPEVGATQLRRSLAAIIAQGNKTGGPWFHGLLAELETSKQNYDRALTLIEQGLALAKQMGEHFTDPYLHRLRGEVLLRHDPAKRAAAEEAFRAAIAVAKEQGARSDALLASLSLAKLYQSTVRAAEAYNILAPVLEGFAPTPEMPEIAEAQALLGRQSG